MKKDPLDIGYTSGDILSQPGDYGTADIFDKIPPSISPEEATKYVIREILKEDTGRHILDSGRLYGMGFERAREIHDWDAISSVEYDEISESHVINIYPYLINYLEYDPDLDQEFSAFAKEKNLDLDECMESFLTEKEYSYYCESTYDKETDLSQVLYYCIGEKIGPDAEEIILLQTHNGADVRGGYSTPHVFKFRFPLCADDFRIGQTYD